MPSPERERFVISRGTAALPEFVAIAPVNSDGFTMLEVMIVVVIVGILAAIALPNYADYVKRGKIIEATSALSDLRTRYEQYYLDNRTYAGGCAVIKPNVNTARSFTIDCPGETATTYSGVATGKAAEGMNGFTYTIDQTNAKTSTGPGGTYTNATCWATRKSGECS